jgi:hypothetical protein
MWHKSPIRVGAYDVFALADIESCDNCKDQQMSGVKVGGTVFLTNALIRRHIPPMGDEHEEYLTKNLHWRCQGLAGEIPREDVTGLEVIVQSAGYEHDPTSADGRPRMTPWTIHAGVTRGRPEGIHQEASE